MFVQGTAEVDCMDKRHKMFECFILYLADDTEKGDMYSPACL